MPLRPRKSSECSRRTPSTFERPKRATTSNRTDLSRENRRKQSPPGAARTANFPQALTARLGHPWSGYEERRVAEEGGKKYKWT